MLFIVKYNSKSPIIEILAYKHEERHQIFLSNAFLLVIRLVFVPFGYFLALSVSFPRPYALLQKGSLLGYNTKSVTH